MSENQTDIGASQSQREWVARVLDVSLAGPPTNGATHAAISPVQLGKSILLWRGVIAKTATDLANLRGKIMTAMHDDADMQADDYAKVEGNFYLLDAVTDRLNESLADELTDLQNAPLDKRASPIATVQARLKEYITFAESDPTLDMLADNEYLPLTTKAELLQTLRAIEATVSV
jgi:hypothetical protein